jgi:hypothetical protein
MYFSKFPLLIYPVQDGSSLKYVYVKNLLRRVALTEDLKSGETAFIQYEIKDGERPEHIAERVYGDPNYHWLILLTNDIIDPYHGWYKSGIAMEEYVQQKHGGYTVYFTNTDNSFFYSTYLDTGATLSQNGNTTAVVDYTPEFCKLTVLGTGFQRGTATIGVSGGNNYTVYIQKVQDSFRAVHHFEVPYTSGLCGANSVATVDPMSQQTGSYSVVGGYVNGTEYEYPHNATDGVGYVSSGTVDLWETYIGRYMGISGSAYTGYAVSNYTYENTENDSKRTIKVLHPRFKRIALEELEALLRV